VQHAIGDHALLADGRTAALVDPTGNVAWLCWPRVDSAPCLLSILDDLNGGVFAVAPEDAAATVTSRAYEPGTLILRTVWRTSGGELTVRDALAGDGAPRLVRSVRARGTVVVAARVALAPDAARVRAVPVAHGTTLHVTGEGLDVAVHAPQAWYIDPRGTAECRFEISEGAIADVVLCDARTADPSAELEGTRQWFAAALASAHAPLNELATATLGEATARTVLEQSAAVLVGLRQRGGGIVAAPTTSLPQWPAGSRTWDYRYSWLRDSALAGLAMLRCGLVDSAADLGAFIGGAAATLPPAVLLRVDGGAPPAEHILDHLRGYHDARPVRIGNAAADQPRLDVAGEVLELAAELEVLDALPASLRDGVATLADWTAENWTIPDHGIWEIRGAARHYTHSRVLAWAGLTRAIALGERGVVEGNVQKWRAAADDVRATVLGGTGPLTLHDRGGGPDAALAQAVLLGFLAADDPRAGDTLDSISASLDRGGLIERHLPEEDSNDELCAPFVFPTFWLAGALRACRRDASRHFAAAAATRGPLDLFGEVADPRDGSPLGNYPQVRSHASFVLAATDGGPPA
jgi:GH15 family glucan-1,4-alpha-glucosidase